MPRYMALHKDGKVRWLGEFRNLADAFTKSLEHHPEVTEIIDEETAVQWYEELRQFLKKPVDV